MSDQEYLDRILTMEIGRCTEAAAVSASLAPSRRSTMIFSSSMRPGRVISRR